MKLRLAQGCVLDRNRCFLLRSFASNIDNVPVEVARKVPNRDYRFHRGLSLFVHVMSMLVFPSRGYAVCLAVHETMLRFQFDRVPMFPALDKRGSRNRTPSMLTFRKSALGRAAPTVWLYCIDRGFPVKSFLPAASRWGALLVNA